MALHENIKVRLTIIFWQNIIIIIEYINMLAGVFFELYGQFIAFAICFIITRFFI